MLGPMDEYPVHQVPQPIAWPGSSDRNFYDRYYFNCFDTGGEFIAIFGLGQYPNLGTTDAFITVRVGEQQHVLAGDRRAAGRLAGEAERVLQCLRPPA